MVPSMPDSGGEMSTVDLRRMCDVAYLSLYEVETVNVFPSEWMCHLCRPPCYIWNPGAVRGWALHQLNVFGKFYVIFSPHSRSRPSIRNFFPVPNGITFGDFRIPHTDLLLLHYNLRVRQRCYYQPLDTTLFFISQFLRQAVIIYNKYTLTYLLQKIYNNNTAILGGSAPLEKPDSNSEN